MGVHTIEVTPLGAGQDVGRSCLWVTIGSKNVILDCGMHMGYNDQRRFPDFKSITGEKTLDELIDCVIISHFHLDHCGALPYMTETVGYRGPIYMTHPTKAITPILLEDYRKLTADKKMTPAEVATDFFTQQNIKDCMNKVRTISLHQTIQVDDELEIKCYYAGHVLGAAMFKIKVGNESVVYTGDYNMTPDRHLGAAWIDKCKPDLLITESTYATTIRDSKRCRERDFLLKVHGCVEKGGKVLIPVFALGRAQELCILLESYWERMNIPVPIYFAVGLTEKATNYYKMFINWTNQKIKNTFVQRNMFDFKHIKPFDRNYMDNPGPMVVFATPGMLHAGLSLQLFRKWAPNKNNMVIMPGYCVNGTIGSKILGGERRIEMENKHILEVNLAVEYMSFSAHADAKGIMQLIQMCQPRNVMLVHGEGGKMHFLKGRIEKEFNIPCFMPANGETSCIQSSMMVPVNVSLPLLKRSIEHQVCSNSKRPKVFHGILVNNRLTGDCRIVSRDEFVSTYGIIPHHITFSFFEPFPLDDLDPNVVMKTLFNHVDKHLKDHYKVILTQDNVIQVQEVSLSTVTGQQSGIMISCVETHTQLGLYLKEFISKLDIRSITSSSLLAPHLHGHITSN